MEGGPVEMLAITQERNSDFLLTFGFDMLGSEVTSCESNRLSRSLEETARKDPTGSKLAFKFVHGNETLVVGVPLYRFKWDFRRICRVALKGRSGRLCRRIVNKKVQTR